MVRAFFVLCATVIGIDKKKAAIAAFTTFQNC
jgi:hypothetical protein